MEIYLVMMGIVVLLGIPLIEIKPTKAKKLCYIIIAFIVMLAVSVFRYGLGNDYYSYYYILQAASKADWLQVFTIGYEPGFALLDKIISCFTMDVQVMFAIYAVLILGMTCYAIYMYSENLWISVMMFISLTFFYNSLSFIRQAMAVAIILLGWRYFKEHDHFKVMLFIFFGALFHSTVIILIPLYFVALMIKPTKVTVPIYAAIIAFVFVFSRQLLDIGVMILPQYKNYLELDFITSGFKPVYIILPSIILALALLAHFTGYGKAYPKASSMFTSMAIFNFVFWLISLKHFILERFSMYPYIFMILFLPSVINYYKQCMLAYLAKQKGLVFTPDVSVYDSMHPEAIESTASENSAEKTEEKTEDKADIQETDSPEKLPARIKKNRKTQYIPDASYYPKNYTPKKFRLAPINAIIHPVTVFTFFMVAVISGSLWYNYFGLTVSSSGIHGVVPYRSTIPAYMEWFMDKEDAADKNRLLNKEKNFFSYLYRITENENYTAVISSSDTNYDGVNDPVRRLLKQRGFEKLSEIENGYFYLAVVDSGEVVYEQVSQAPIEYSAEINGFDIYTRSAKDNSSVLIDGREYSYNRRGLNIAVMDNTKRTAADMLRVKAYYVMLEITRD